MQYPLSTGALALELGVTEPRLNDLIRRGKITPIPRIVAGRRYWFEKHAAAARSALAALANSKAGDAK